MPPPKHACMYARDIAEYSAEVVCNVMVSFTAFYLIFTAQLTHPFNGPFFQDYQWCIGGYTRVYGVYQPPGFFDSVYSRQ